MAIQDLTKLILTAICLVVVVTGLQRFKRTAYG
jgi:hypothetical protein